MPMIQTGFKQTYYKEWLPPSGAIEGTAHGLGATHNFFTPLIPHLTTAGHRCIAYDLPGMGLSSPSSSSSSSSSSAAAERDQQQRPRPPQQQTLDTLALDALALMDALHLPTAAFVGHSLSSLVGPCLAATWPQRITALVLCAPVLVTAAIVGVFEGRIAIVERERGLECVADKVVLGQGATELQKAFVRGLVLGNHQRHEAYVSLCRAIVGAGRDGMGPRYEQVECPVLIVAGREDKNPSVQMCETVLGRLGSERKRIKVLEGVGHWTVVDAPDETGMAIRDFLSRVQEDVLI